MGFAILFSLQKLLQIKYPSSEILKSENLQNLQVFADRICHKWKISESAGKVPRWWCCCCKWLHLLWVGVPQPSYIAYISGSIFRDCHSNAFICGLLTRCKRRVCKCHILWWGRQVNKWISLKLHFVNCCHMYQSLSLYCFCSSGDFNILQRNRKAYFFYCQQKHSLFVRKC